MDMVSYLLAKNASGGGGGVTMEEVLQITGELEDLDTTDKSNLVSAINELAVNDIPTIDFTDAGQVLQMIDDATTEDKSGVFVYATNIGESMDYNTYAYIEIISGTSGKAYYGENIASFSIVTDEETGDSVVVYGSVETVATEKYVDDAIASAGGSGIDITPLQTRSIDFANFKKGIYAFGSNSIMYSSITANCSTFATAQGNMKSYYCNGIIVVLKDITSDLQNGEPIIMMTGMGNGKQTTTILSVDRTSATGLSEHKIYDDELMMLAGLQTVSGKKIFSVLPETSIVPTTDNQMVNKKYVDDAVAGAGGDGQIPTLVLDNPYTFVSGGSVTDSDMLSFFSTRITEMLTETPKKGLILIEYNNSGKSELWCCTENVSSQSTQYNFYLVNTEVKSANYRYALAVRGAWANDVFTCSHIMTVQDSYSFVLSNQVLTKTNNDSYTPTGNYNPATKKYVDDAISAAITTTLGGSY